MPSIRINNFGGIKPKESRGNGDPTRASIARNVNLEHGSLHPWRYPSLEIETGLDKVCSISKHECCLLVDDNPCASFTKGDTDCQRVFSTGVMPWPAYAVVQKGNNCCEEICETEWCRLGVPQPEIMPDITGGYTLTDPIDGPNVVTGNYDCTVKGNFQACDYLSTPEILGGSPNTELDEYCDLQGRPTAEPWQSDAFEQKKREPRMYAYTFVNEFGEESQPSMPSLSVDMDYDSQAEISFIVPEMTDGYCDPTYIRIYRGVPSVPDDEPAVANQIDMENYYANVNSVFLLVAEIPYVDGMITFLDDTPPDCLGEACASEYNSVPLECLQNIQVLETGALIASEGKNLWFSEPFKFNAWSCHMNLDDCVINFKATRDRIYVATDGFPYIIDVRENQDNQECKCCRPVNKMLEPAPIVSGCSMVVTNNGAMWATDTGLARLDGNGFRIDTHAHMAEDDWGEWYPHQLKGAWYKGKYFGFNSERGFIWDANDGMYSETYLGDSGKFTTLDLTPDAVYRSDNNELYMSFNGDIYKWNQSDTYMPYTWRSKLHVEGGLKNFSIAKVVFEDWLRTKKSPNEAVVRFYADDKMMFQRTVNNSRPFRLPKGYDALNFEIEIQSIEPIMEFHMATSKMELINLNNS